MRATNRKVFSRYLTEPEERQLWRCVKQYGDLLSRRDYAWMRLMRHSGIRVGTAAGLTVGHGLAAISIKHLMIEADINKGNSDHSVFMNGSARQAVRDLLKIRREMGYPAMSDQPLIMSRNHRALSVRSYQSRMVHWRNLAELPEVSPHWFRHTLGKRIMKNSTADDPRGVVQVVLGHEDINTSATYTMPDREEIERIMEEIG